MTCEQQTIWFLVFGSFVKCFACLVCKRMSALLVDELIDIFGDSTHKNTQEILTDIELSVYGWIRSMFDITFNNFFHHNINEFNKSRDFKFVFFSFKYHHLNHIQCSIL